MLSDGGPGPPRVSKSVEQDDRYGPGGSSRAEDGERGSSRILGEGKGDGKTCGSTDGSPPSLLFKPKKVYARLCKTSPYIGTFHYAPSAGNRSRQIYFEKDIVSLEIVRRQHDVRSNPMIGNFHYGDDLYGKRFQDFQRTLTSIRAREAARQQEQLLRERSRSLANGERCMPPGHLATHRSGSAGSGLGEAGGGDGDREEQEEVHTRGRARSDVCLLKETQQLQHASSDQGEGSHLDCGEGRSGARA
ncbi:unnamed protein product, partial [Discosporangium mesarthrocarpum]